MTDNPKMTEDVVLLREGDDDRLREQLTEARARCTKNRAEIRLLEKKLHAAEYLTRCVTDGQ